MSSIKMPLWTLILVIAMVLPGCYTAERSAELGDIMTTSNNNGEPVPGPVNPIPDLWKPPIGATPATGNFVYLESEPNDPVGGGNTYLYTPSNATITANATGNHLSVYVNGAENWIGEFKTKNSLSEFQKGFYDGLWQYPYHDTAFGGLDWYGTNKCSALNGWFAVDEVVYTSSVMATIQLRFEQVCEGGTAALHGKIRFTF